LFISYSQKNRDWLQQLKTHLLPWEIETSFQSWDDTRIEPGADWQKEIELALTRVHVAILLVSPEYLASAFIRTYEFPALYRAYVRGELKILWVLLSHCNWEALPEICRRQAVIPADRSLAAMDGEERNKAFVKITRHINEKFQQIQALQPQPPPLDVSIPTSKDVLVCEGNEGIIIKKKILVTGYEERLAEGVAITMVQIPEGEFLMGSPDDEAHRSVHEGPQHRVSLSSFFMAQAPVTQAQWQVVTGWPKVSIDLDANPSRFKGDNRPVEKVNWLEAIEFCRRLSQRSGHQYTLPSEAQWEYGCRAGTSTAFCFGELLSKDQAHYDEPLNHEDVTRPLWKHAIDVASFAANEWGLYDMHGNVMEWCLDFWHEDYQGAPVDGSAWIAGGSSSRLLRGGSWYDFQSSCRSAYRIHMRSYDVRDDVGFRVVCLSKRIPPNV
jgi:formylglycine-generating enzyme required for sulfatase activity